jgi:tRNA nucleotidyltransferase (CCA-adding enzyme)
MIELRMVSERLLLPFLQNASLSSPKGDKEEAAAHGRKSRPVAANPKIDPAELPRRLRAIPAFQQLQTAAEGAPAYLVGGAVRDLLLGQPHPDLDVVIEGQVRPIAEALGGELTEHERFETATVRLGELRVDLARARSERYPHPGALPTVTPATIDLDLARRDFTINAMAVPLHGEHIMIDPHHGAADLAAGLLRVLHEGSFRDDPTRALRAARYAARLGFELEPQTERLLREADLSTVSEDRVVDELGQVAAESRPSAALELIDAWGLLDLASGHRLAAALEELFEADREWAGYANRERAILLAVAPGDHPARLRQRAAAIAHHAEPGSPAEIQVLAHDHVPEVLAMARTAGAEWLDEYVHRLRHVELEITGYDLMDAGVPEGPAVGRGLNAALAAKLDGEVSGREEELRVALTAAHNRQD